MRYKVCNKKYLAERKKYLAERKKYQGENKKSLRRQEKMSAQSVAMVNYVTRLWRVAFLCLTAQKCRMYLSRRTFTQGVALGSGQQLGFS